MPNGRRQNLTNNIYIFQAKPTIQFNKTEFKGMLKFNTTEPENLVFQSMYLFFPFFFATRADIQKSVSFEISINLRGKMFSEEF